MGSIHKALLQFIFSGSYMKRWNDKLRPMEFVEVDKQAHKMIVAWLLSELCAKDMDEQSGLDLRLAVIERGLFDYFFRLIITDIKPPVYYQMKDNQEDYKKLAIWALNEMERHLRPVGENFWERLTTHILHPTEDDAAAHILAAAHSYASYWEFKVLAPFNQFDEEIKAEIRDIDQRFVDELKEHARHVPQLAAFKKGSAVGRFAGLCGQLRFQKRWSQTPRIPETSVMGHMFIVAAYAYFFSLHMGACPARMINNFFCGLFHDLPEVLTRDIISPVKRSVDHLGELIRSYENREIERRVIGPLRQEGYSGIAGRLSYYLGIEAGSEFKETVILDGVLKTLDFSELHSKYNEDRYDPKDGKMLKTCDSLAAFIEAWSAVRNGIHSDQLQEGIWRIRTEHAKEVFGDLHIGSIFADFA